MSTARRGISHHRLVEMIETCNMRLRRMGITGEQADRIMTGIVLRSCDFTAEQAIEAAERLFPRKATEPAGGLESPATNRDELANSGLDKFDS